jgi:hypothetical protein
VASPFAFPRWTLVGLLCAALFSACGGSEDGEQPQTVTVTESTEAETPTTDKPGPKRAREQPPSVGERAEAVVEGYYVAVDSGNYREAWSLLGPTLQGELGGYGAWRDGYANTVSTKVSDVHATDVSPGSVTVALKLAATDLDACGDTVDQTFAGTWTLAPAAGDLLGTAFGVDKTGGGTPVTDASSCGGGGGPVPVSPAGCDPNYTGCVPPYPPDVDCIDVGQEVEVIGEDVHRLDIGGDGEACELFLR